MGWELINVIAATTPVVHTTGVNWISVLTITLTIVTLLSIILGLVSRVLANRITGAIDKFRIDVVTQLDTRLTRVEAKLESIKVTGDEASEASKADRRSRNR